MELTLKINTRTNLGKSFLAMLENLVKVNKAVEIVESPYDPKFVKKIQKARAEVAKGNTTVIDTNDIWGSLGLK